MNDVPQILEHAGMDMSTDSGFTEFSSPTILKLAIGMAVSLVNNGKNNFADVPSATTSDNMPPIPAGSAAQVASGRIDAAYNSSSLYGMHSPKLIMLAASSIALTKMFIRTA